MVGTTLIPIFVGVYGRLREVLTMIAALPMQRRRSTLLQLAGSPDRLRRIAYERVQVRNALTRAPAPDVEFASP